MNKIAVTKLIAGILGLLCSQVSIAAVDDPDSQSLGGANTNPRHRIDISGIYLGGLAADSISGIFGYTYSLTSNSNVSVSVPYINPETGKGGDNGFGDGS